MKKIFHILLLSFFVISCSSDNDEPSLEGEPTEVLEGKQIFRIDLKSLTAKGISADKQKNLEPAFAILSVNDSDGVSILTREKISLVKVGDSYVTNEITLESGTYSVIEFIVTDINDVVISIAPKENSVFAQFTTKPLPFDFVVSTDETKETATENINAAGYTSVDFGYTELSLTFPENTDFFSLTVDDSFLLTTKTLNLKSITGSTYLVDWGDGTVEEYVSTIIDSGIENEISHTYAEKGEFIINVSGPVAAIETLSFFGELPDDLYQYQTNLVAIDISKLNLLRNLSIYTGKLTSIDISNNIALENLSLRRNALLSIDLINNPNLIEVFVDDNSLTSIDVSTNLNLENLNVTANQLTNLDVSNNSKLRILNAWENQLNFIDLSNNIDLSLLNLNHNALAAIDISKNLNLLEIIAGDNQITSVDVSNNPELRRIDLFQNQLTSIDVSNNLNLNGLYIDYNQISELNLAHNTNLEYLTVENNMLSELNLVTNPKAFVFHIGANQFSASDLDIILSQIYDNAVLNSIMDGYIDYQNTPGFSEIDPTTIIKLNKLAADYNWTFNNN
ncbi:leucine-rich repeat domain-containing protein [Maribacter aurantiacus]|uniref:Uncharacterized protein n=1 Tax=Maribacter aurantiacus TaxID=1882343 RepID=A0A5R8LU59_9FLAO|nr:hypothetical protein [Maribacter aurantiacus]TLF40765.1 hypothetical protein FEK29_16985 [Maribacter aurantiacus]